MCSKELLPSSLLRPMGRSLASLGVARRRKAKRPRRSLLSQRIQALPNQPNLRSRSRRTRRRRMRRRHRAVVWKCHLVCPASSFRAPSMASASWSREIVHQILGSIQQEVEIHHWIISDWAPPKTLPPFGSSCGLWPECGQFA